MAGLTPVAPGEVAAIVTSLEMLAPPPSRPIPPSPLSLDRWDRPSPARYRALFRRVGAPWLWFSRLVMDEERLLSIIHDPEVHVFAATGADSAELGMLELDYRRPGMCELSYVALTPPMVGRGHGRWLMANALALAWRAEIERVWVHTCTLDHPRALPFYLASGFTAYARTVEIFPDPRLSGDLPREAAPHVPLLASRR